MTKSTILDAYAVLDAALGVDLADSAWGSRHKYSDIEFSWTDEPGEIELLCSRPEDAKVLKAALKKGGVLSRIDRKTPSALRVETNYSWKG